MLHDLKDTGDGVGMDMNGSFHVVGYWSLGDGLDCTFGIF